MNEVYLVLDKKWKENLFTTSRNRHIWICNSEQNDIQIQETWKMDKEYNLNKGVTSFKIHDSLLNEFYNIIDQIQIHHCAGASNINEWKRIVVFGIDYNEIMKTEIEEILDSKVDIEKNENGFCIIKK